MVLFTKHHLIFMSSETIAENKLSTIASLKTSNDVDLVRQYGVRIPVLQRSDKAELGWPFDSLDVERFSS